MVAELKNPRGDVTLHPTDRSPGGAIAGRRGPATDNHHELLSMKGNTFLSLLHHANLSIAPALAFTRLFPLQNCIELELRVSCRDCARVCTD